MWFIKSPPGLEAAAGILNGVIATFYLLVIIVGFYFIGLTFWEVLCVVSAIS